MHMQQALEILKTGNKVSAETGFELLYKKEQNIPGAIQFKMNRYFPSKPWISEDTGMMVYHYNSKDNNENFLELRYCVTGNKYCPEKSCSFCEEKPTEGCQGKLQTVDTYVFHFSYSFLQQFTHNVKLTSKKDEVLAFKNKNSFTKTFILNNQSRKVLDGLLNHSYTGSMENVYLNAKIHEILVYSLDGLVEEKKIGYTCKFLEDEHSREAVYKSREILIEHIGDPLTIRELSRKVAINECYLKKGFKEIFGTTIFDFYQQQRMEHAKYLLHEENLSVTDVSGQLGYSSISHFSAAFKKHTGLKPCDLLN